MLNKFIPRIKIKDNELIIFNKSSGLNKSLFKVVKKHLYDNYTEGLSDKQIKNIFLKHDFGHIPVIMSNEINKLDIPKGVRHYGFVINSAPEISDLYHWKGIFIDFINHIVYYYDSLVSSPSISFKNDLSNLLDDYGCNYFFRFVVNTTKDQQDTSNNCGFFATLFIMGMMDGIPFDIISDIKEDTVEIFKDYI